MTFSYGISPKSLERWKAFEAMTAAQAQRGPDVACVAMAHLIDAELESIERATADAEALESARLRRSPNQTA